MVTKHKPQIDNLNAKSCTIYLYSCIKFFWQHTPAILASVDRPINFTSDVTPQHSGEGARLEANKLLFNSSDKVENKVTDACEGDRLMYQDKLRVVRGT